MSSHILSRRSPRSAFTLVEILVVVAIIGLLTAILFPAFSSAREAGRRASCQSNLRQIGLAMTEYTQDYDETYPAFYGESFNGAPGETNNTWKLLQPYVKSEQIFYCPSTTAYNDCLPYTGCTSSGKEISYGFNLGPAWNENIGAIVGGIYRQYGQDSNGRIFIEGTRVPAVSDAGHMFLASDAYDVWVNSMDPTAFFQPPRPTRNSQWRHGNWRNVLFADGHVKIIQWHADEPTNTDDVNVGVMLPRDTSYYDSYCANPDDNINFPDTQWTRCGDVAQRMADSVTKWQPD